VISGSTAQHIKQPIGNPVPRTCSTSGFVPLPVL